MSILRAATSFQKVFSSGDVAIKVTMYPRFDPDNETISTQTAYTIDSDFGSRDFTMKELIPIFFEYRDVRYFKSRKSYDETEPLHAFVKIIYHDKKFLDIFSAYEREEILEKSLMILTI